MKSSVRTAKRLCGAFLAMCMVLALLPLSAFAAGRNGTSGENAISNPSFETPAYSTNPPVRFIPAAETDGWSTTATDGLIEFANVKITGRIPHIFAGSDQWVAEGDQCVELNAHQVSTLYQDTDTADGYIYEWGLSHRGRQGIDKMALIIGPTQENAPKKPSYTGRDQFMRLTDWIQRNRVTLGVTIPTTGCSEKITVYSKPFDSNGDFVNNGEGSNQPFSQTPSDIYTEEWSVWIVSTDNSHWGKYGTNSTSYDADKGIGGGLSYDCSYTVPTGQRKTTFAFCSYSAATNDKSVGNLIDDLHFSLYHTVTVSATAGGEGSVEITSGSTSRSYPVSEGSPVSAIVRDDSELIVKATERTTSDKSGAVFVGAYITRQGTNGQPEKVFIPAADSRWTAVTNGNTTVYTYSAVISEPADIVLIFVKTPTITYDSNGGAQYVYEPGAEAPTNIVSFAPAEGSAEPRASYTSHSAEGEPGWLFTGWLLARENRVLPAVHTVSYDAENETFTFTSNDGSAPLSIKTGGVALIAQWRWLQSFVPQVQNADNTYTTDYSCGQIYVANDSGASTSYYAETGESVTVTAQANPGYAFIGWYKLTDSGYQQVSRGASYTYFVGKEDLQTTYARFVPALTVTYQWDSSLNAADFPRVPSQETTLSGDDYIISTLYIPNETHFPGTLGGVPGKWIFTGWKDASQEDGDYLGSEISNVTRGYILTGYWSFVADQAYTVSYDHQDGQTCWLPSGIGALPGPDSYYANNTVTVPQAPTIADSTQLVLDYERTYTGTWHFDGWLRSDTGTLVSPGSTFQMPADNISLTAKWTFTPGVYTVTYDANGGSGPVPAGHMIYAYSEFTGKAGVNTPEGIPFGALVTAGDYTGTAPSDDVYFVGWGLSPAGGVKFSPGQEINHMDLGITTSGQNVVLYAIYEPIGTINVEFISSNPNHGTVTERSGTFQVMNGAVSGENAVSVAVPAVGYHFSGWQLLLGSGSIAGVSTGDAAITVTAANLAAAHENDVIRYQALFEPNEFTVRFHADIDGAQGSMADQSFSYLNRAVGSEHLNDIGFTKPGFSFTSWSEYSAAEIAAGSTGLTYENQALFHGVSTYRGVNIQHGDVIDLYAQWAELPHVTISYAAYPENLGTVVLNTPEPPVTFPSVNYVVQESGNPETGTFYGATAVENPGSVFTGWYDLSENCISTDKVLSLDAVNKVDGLYSNASYIARFSPQKYTLTYDSNGGNNTMEPQEFSHSASQNLSVCAFEKPGYDFAGWALSPDGDPIYHDQQSIQIAEDMTLYAAWVEKTVTILYKSQDADMGTVSPGSETFGAVTGIAAGSTAAPKSGYRFVCWYNSAAEKVSENFQFIPEKTGDIWEEQVYYAHFEEVETIIPTPSPTPAPSGGRTPPATLNSIDHLAYIVGFEDGTIRPDAPITRAEVATIFFRLLTDDAREANLTRENSYPDVGADAWYSAAVSTLSRMGIITGYPDGTFRPDAPITRAEFTAIAARFDSSAVSVELPFTDLQNCWALDEIARAYSNGWITGYADGTFRPSQDITRAEVITLINRVLQRVPGSREDLLATAPVWKDNPPEYWAYIAIQEATCSHYYERRADGHETHTAPRPDRDWAAEFEKTK